MEIKAFENLGDIRNIIDISNVKEIIEQMLNTQDLNGHENIKVWINRNFKNHILKKSSIKEIIDLNYFNDEKRNLIKEKKIQAPYHEIIIEDNLIEEVNHVIDYLKDSFNENKSLDRISYEQAKINAELWLKNKIRRLDGEEDVSFVIPVMSFIHNEQKYTWVNIRSHKALKRESFMMNNCIESYWKRFSKDSETSNIKSPYYSLRDLNNNSIISLNAEEKDRFIEVLEIKEKNNQFLTNEKRVFTDILFKDEGFHQQKNIEFRVLEANKSKYYLLDNERKYYSINEIVKNKFPSKRNTIKWEEVKNDYSIKELIDIFRFDKVEIEKTLNSTLDSKIIELNKIENEEITIITQNLRLLNTNNIKVNIEINEICTIYLENVHNANINISSPKNKGVNYILKNCSDISIEGNAKMWDKKILQINCENIKFAKSYNSIDKKLIVNDLNPLEFEVSKRFLELMNFSSTKAYNATLKEMFEFYLCYIEELGTKNIYTDILKQINLDYEIKNEDFNNCKFIVNDKEIKNQEELVKNIFNNPNKLIESLLNEIEVENLILNSNLFVRTNSYEILNSENLNLIKCFNQKIKNQYDIINTCLMKAEIKYNEILNNDDDNLFTDYIEAFYENIKIEKTEISMNLMCYLLKNEMLKLTFNALEEKKLKNISYRFNVEEKKMKTFFTKRLANYFINDGQRERLDSKENKEYINILGQPYDKNILLKPIMENHKKMKV